MAGVARGDSIKPGRWTWSAGRLAPEARAIVDAKLRALWPLWEGGGGVYNVGRKRLAAGTLTSGVTWTPGPAGMGTVSDGGANHYLALPTDPMLEESGSALVVFSGAAIAGNEQLLHTYNTTANFEGFWLALVSDGSLRYQAYDASTKRIGMTSAQAGYGDGKPHAVGITFPRVTTEPDAFMVVDGSVAAIDGASPTANWSFGASANNRLYENGGAFFNEGLFNVYLVAHFDLLTQAELQALTRDPLSLLRPWRPPQAAGGGTTHALSGTLPLALALDAAIEVRRALAASLPLTLAPSGTIEVRRALAGALPLALQLSGALSTEPAVLGDVTVSDAARGGAAASLAALGGLGLGDAAARGALEVSDG
jgi:hypothetical protein